MSGFGKFIGFLLIVDSFFVCYYLGFNSRHVLVVDPTMQPVVAKQAEKAADKTDATKPGAEKTDSAAKPGDDKKPAEAKADAHSEKPKSHSGKSKGHKRKHS